MGGRAVLVLHENHEVLDFLLHHGDNLVLALNFLP